MDITKECKKHGQTLFRQRSDNGYYRCLRCRSEAVSKRRRKLKKKLVEYFGGKCIKCGYSKCIWALTFHHKDPKEKDFTISSGDTRAWKTLLGEAKKCDLVCMNCHAELHYEV